MREFLYKSNNSDSSRSLLRNMMKDLLRISLNYQTIIINSYQGSRRLVTQSFLKKRSCFHQTAMVSTNCNRIKLYCLLIIMNGNIVFCIQKVVLSRTVKITFLSEMVLRFILAKMGENICFSDPFARSCKFGKMT